jgi:hypothetical protein
MQTLFTFYLVLLALTTLTGLVSFPRLTGPFRLLVFVVCYVFAVELLGRILVYAGFTSLAPLYHLNAVVLISFFGMIYFRLFETNVVLKKITLILTICCILIAVLNTLYHQSLHVIPTFSIAANAFQCIVLSLTLFNEMIKSPSRIPIQKQALFWLNSGVFIFFSANFVGFILYNEYYQIKGIAQEFLFYLNWSGNMILYASYLLGFYFNQKQT